MFLSTLLIPFFYVVVRPSRFRIISDTRGLVSTVYETFPSGSLSPASFALTLWAADTVLAWPNLQARVQDSVTFCNVSDSLLPLLFVLDFEATTAVSPVWGRVEGSPAAQPAGSCHLGILLLLEGRVRVPASFPPLWPSRFPRNLPC